MGAVVSARTVHVRGQATIAGNVRAETLVVGGTLHQAGRSKRLSAPVDVPPAIDTDGMDQVTTQFTTPLAVVADQVIVRGAAEVGAVATAHKRIVVGSSLTVGANLSAKHVIIDGDATVGNMVSARSVTADRVVRS